MTRFFGRSAVFSLLVMGVSLSAAIAFLLILYQILGGQEMIDKVTCFVGLNEDCIIADLREENRQLDDELAAKRTELAGLEALRDRLAEMDYASESFVVFYSTDIAGMQVVSGNRYASLLKPNEFDAAWCYIELPDIGGVDAKLSIARMGFGRSVEPHDITETALNRAGISRSQLTTALSACHWPELGS